MVNSRRKGGDNERGIAHLLVEYGFEITDQPCGKSVPDFIAERNGIRYCVECKDVALQDLTKFRGQARRQRDAWQHDHPKTGPYRWMLIAHWPGYAGTYQVEGQDIRPCVWRSNAGRRTA